MAHSYNYLHMGSESKRVVVVEEEDFDEADIWAVMKDMKNSSPKAKKPKDPSLSSSPALRRLPTGSRSIPRTQSMESGRASQRSAPVNITDWSGVDRNIGFDGPEDRQTIVDDDIDDDDDRVPPHECIERRIAMSQVSSFSVFEGAGRTLKGRDLSKVRNAVLTRTGFFE
ncbi:hypothetical protein QJS04_geneDACA018025 [Acorus gramineus]|uniref:Senescence regulator S40 n=1 Tax=Acorus gramineus TaxID=55184 RepID=A0AAV9AA39_ACOGR|nr:hypothetical protein QJS04_geneDACA018025 [Acorus gramineus]